MVARLWRGATRVEKANAYVEYLRRTGATECRRAPGNQGVTILRAIYADRADFLFISFWESLSAIKGFAGPSIDEAVYYPEDSEFLLEMEPGVIHYEVVVDEGDAA